MILQILKAEVGVVEWSESTDPNAAPLLLKFQFLDGSDNPLSYIAPGLINEFHYLNETYPNGVNSGFVWPTVYGGSYGSTYLIEESTVPAEQLLGVYDLKLNDFAGGNYHREDDNFNNIQIDISIDVQIFGTSSSYQLTYPFQIQTLITNEAPFGPTDPIFISFNPTGMNGYGILASMLALDTYGVNYDINNNSGTTETFDNITGQFPSAYGMRTKTFNGSNPNIINKVIPPSFAGENELVYNLYLETSVGSGLYDEISTTDMTGLTLSSSTSAVDGGLEYTVSVEDVKYNGSAAPGIWGYAIGATDKNGLGLTTYVSKFNMSIIY